ncbi:ComEC/Rec2 family competence protein [Pelagibacterium montanilacus]|uniref:ComEC/Rec2 family competence protein n=1 Tax=Pelagibacterium montanilacus TaxID=2185280 RepID=UPI0013E039A5|nr:ComEC/Rec2 family competence protein [Pelagibacterium montanilacus]
MAALHRETVHAVEQRRLIALTPFAAIAGAIAYRIAPAEPDAVLYVAGFVALGLAFLTTLSRPFVHRIIVLALAGWIGFAILPLHGTLGGTRMLESSRYGTFDARIDQVIFDDGASQRWIVSEIVAHEDWSDPAIRRARLAVSGSFDVAPGDRFTGRMRFYPIPGPVVPGGFDSQFAGYFDGIGAYGTLFATPEIQFLSRAPGGWETMVARLRTTITERIVEVLGNRIGGIAAALITGDQSRLDEQDRAVMASAGLAHVLAISGLHLSLVAGTAFAALRYGLVVSHRLAQRIPAKRIAAAGAIGVALGYLVISGMGVSAIRATIMLCLVFAAVVLGRQALTMRNVAIAALILIAVDPASIFRASFQLSFAAVIALIAAFELARRTREKRLSPRNGVIRLFFDIAMTSLISGAATMLFTAYHFQQTAPFGLLGNLMAMPLVTFVMMPMALIAMLLMPLGLEAVPLAIMGKAIEAVLWCAHAVRSMSGGFDPAPILTPVALVAGLFALGWLAFFRSRIRLWGTIVALPVIVLFGTASRPDIIIADGTQALAARHAPGLALIAGRANTFAPTIWSERYMEPIGARPEEMRCDAIGCIFVSGQGFTLALVENVMAFHEDCAVADIVVTRIPAPSQCRETTQVVDQTDLSVGGVHVLRWEPERGTFTIARAIEDESRPWRIAPR